MLTLACFDDASQNLVVLVQVALVTKEFPSQKKVGPYDFMEIKSITSHLYVNDRSIKHLCKF